MDERRTTLPHERDRRAVMAGSDVARRVGQESATTDDLGRDRNLRPGARGVTSWLSRAAASP